MKIIANTPCINRLSLFHQSNRCTIAVVSTLTALILTVGGCWNSGSVSDPVRVSTPPPPAREAPKLPEVTQTLDQVRQEMVLFDKYSPEFDEGRVKMAVLQDDLRKKHGVAGFQQQESPPTATYNSPSAVADPSGRVAWRAMTCCNPKCHAVGRGGGPFLFTIQYSWITVGPDGKLNVGPPNIEEINRPVYCPACKSGDYIRFYDLPETAVRERALKEELIKSYSAYATAAQAKQGKPAGVRSPDEIQKEIESLQRLYLLSEQGKTKEFDAVTAPVQSGPDGTP
jgi:hypothetical protein